MRAGDGKQAEELFASAVLATAAAPNVDAIYGMGVLKLGRGTVSCARRIQEVVILVRHAVVVDVVIVVVVVSCLCWLHLARFCSDLLVLARLITQSTLCTVYRFASICPV